MKSINCDGSQVPEWECPVRVPVKLHTENLPIIMLEDKGALEKRGHPGSRDEVAFDAPDRLDFCSWECVGKYAEWKIEQVAKRVPLPELPPLPPLVEDESP